MNHQSRMWVLSMMIVMALLVSACGGKKEEAKVNAAPAQAEQAAEKPAEAAAVQGDATKGQQTYQTACVACHGPDAKGVQNLGKSLHPSDSEFVTASSDDELVEFIKVGRQPDDPANTTGIAMPPKGGNPAISDADLYNIVAWIRTLD
jgi:disulfide bond formation protein DsbB